MDNEGKSAIDYIKVNYKIEIFKHLIESTERKVLVIPKGVVLRRHARRAECYLKSKYFIRVKDAFDECDTDSEGCMSFHKFHAFLNSVFQYNCCDKFYEFFKFDRFHLVSTGAEGVAIILFQLAVAFNTLLFNSKYDALGDEGWVNDKCGIEIKVDSVAAVPANIDEGLRVQKSSVLLLVQVLLGIIEDSLGCIVLLRSLTMVPFSLYYEEYTSDDAYDDARVMMMMNVANADTLRDKHSGISYFEKLRAIQNRLRFRGYHFENPRPERNIAWPTFDKRTIEKITDWFQIDISSKWVHDYSGTDRYIGISYFEQLNQVWSTIRRNESEPDTTTQSVNLEEWLRFGCAEDPLPQLVFDDRPGWTMIEGTWDTPMERQNESEPDTTTQSVNFEEWLRFDCAEDPLPQLVFDDRPGWTMIEGTWDTPTEPLHESRTLTLSEQLARIGRPCRRIAKHIGRSKKYVYQFLRSFIMANHISQRKFERLLSQSNEDMDESEAFVAIKNAWGWYPGENDDEKPQIETFQWGSQKVSVLTLNPGRFTSPSFEAFVEAHNKNIDAFDKLLCSQFQPKCVTWDKQYYASQLLADSRLRSISQIFYWIGEVMPFLRSGASPCMYHHNSHTAYKSVRWKVTVSSCSNPSYSDQYSSILSEPCLQQTLQGFKLRKANEEKITVKLIVEQCAILASIFLQREDGLSTERTRRFPTTSTNTSAIVCVELTGVESYEEISLDVGSSFLYSCRSGNSTLATSLMTRMRDLNCRYIYMSNLLFRGFSFAFKYGLHDIIHVNVSNYCKDSIQSIYSQDQLGDTVLIRASADGHEDMVKYLVSHGVALDIRNNKGETALIHAVWRGDENIVKYLVSNGASLDILNNEGETELIRAARNGEYDVVKCLIANGAALDIKNKKGETALILAVEWILNNVEDLDSVGTDDMDGDIPWSLVTTDKNLDIVKYLVSHGASLDIRDNNGGTALIRAVTWYGDGVVEYLATQGAALDILNDEGETALILAARRGNENIVKYLVSNGASIDIEDMQGDTALICAAKNGAHETVKYLVSQETSLDSRNEKGDTKLALLCVALTQYHDNGEGMERDITEYVDVVKYLASHGLLLDIKNKYGDNTQFMSAVDGGYDDILDYLVSHGASRDLKDKFGRRAFDSVAKKGLDGIIDYLVSIGDSITCDRSIFTEQLVGRLQEVLKQGFVKVDAATLLKKKQEEEAAAALMKKQEEEAAAAALLKKQEEEAAAALREREAEISKNQHDEAAVSAIRNSTGSADIKKFLVQNCEMSELKANKLVETLYANEITGMKRLSYAHRKKSLDSILKSHQPALSDLDLELIFDELGAQDASTTAINRSSASVYQWNPSPMCIIENVAPMTDRITSRGGILIGTYTHKQKVNEVVIKCYNKDRDLQREVTILTKLGNNPSWIMYEHFYDCSPIENSYLVLERCGVNLDIYLRHMDITLNKESKRIIVKEVCHAVHSLHGKGVMHGDLKPQNILIREHGGIHVKLCDFDSARDVCEREEFPNDGTSLKFTREYVSPEVFRGRNLHGGVLLASLEIDLFSLGLICALLLDSRVNSMSTLLPTELSDTELERYLFDQPYLNSRLQCDEGVHYRTCIRQFCSVESRQRGSINDILPQIDNTTTHYTTANQRLQADNEYIKLSHERIMRAFQLNLDSFGNNLVIKLNTANTADTNIWKAIEKKFDEQAQRIEVCVDMQTAQSRMLGTVISGTYSIPTLCIVLPQVNRTVWSRFNPVNMHIVTDAYRMFFICSHTLRIVPCGPKGKGYKFSETKQWVRRAAPVIKVGLLLLKLGLLASGLPLPIPGLEDIVDKDNSISYIDASIKVLEGSDDDRFTEVNSSSFTIEDHLVSLNRNDTEIRSAYEAIKTLLTDPSKGLDKQLQYLNMLQRTCETTGITGWIRNDPNVIKSFDDNKGRRVV